MSTPNQQPEEGGGNPQTAAFSVVASSFQNLNSLQTPTTSKAHDSHDVEQLADDLDLMISGNIQSSFYGGKGASFDRLQALNGVIRVTAQLRHKNGDLVQLLPEQDPGYEAQLTLADNNGNDLTHTETLNLGRFPEHPQYQGMSGSTRSKRTTYVRIPFTDEKNVFTPMITFPSFVVEVISSQITTHLMKIKVIVFRGGQLMPHLTRFSLPFEVKNFRGPEMNAKAKARRSGVTSNSLVQPVGLSTPGSSDDTPKRARYSEGGTPADRPHSGVTSALSAIGPIPFPSAISQPSTTNGSTGTTSATVHNLFIQTIGTVQHAGLSNDEKQKLTTTLLVAQNMLMASDTFMHTKDEGSYTVQLRSCLALLFNLNQAAVRQTPPGPSSEAGGTSESENE